MNKKMAILLIISILPLSIGLSQYYLLFNITKSPNIISIDYTDSEMVGETHYYGSGYSSIFGFNLGIMGFLDNSKNKGFGGKVFLDVVDRSKFNLNLENPTFGSDSYEWKFHNVAFSFGGFYYYKINTIYLQPYGMIQLGSYDLNLSDSDSGGSVFNMGADVGIDLHLTTDSIMGFFLSMGYNLNIVQEAKFNIETDVAIVYPGDDPEWTWANHEAKLKNNFFRIMFGMSFKID